MKKSMLALSVLITTFSAPLAFAGTLNVTCGQQAFEALEEKEPSKAEFALVLKTKGKNNPPEIVSFQDDFEDRTDDAEIAKYELEDGVYSIIVGSGRDKTYEISGLTDCDDLEESTGKVVAKQSVPRGFVGYKILGSAECNCSKE